MTRREEKKPISIKVWISGAIVHVACWKETNLQKMITYAEMRLALNNKKIDIPSTMTKGKHLKGETHLCRCFSSTSSKGIKKKRSLAALQRYMPSLCHKKKRSWFMFRRWTSFA